MNGIAPDPVGPGKVRPLAAEDDDRESRGGEEDDEGEDDVLVEGLVFPGKAEKAGPDGLADQGLAGDPEAGMDIGHAPEESPVLGHGHVDPGTVEDGRAQAAEDGDHDGRRDGRSRRRPEELGGGELADADDPLHLLHRQGQDIDDIDHEIDQR